MSQKTESAAPLDLPMTPIDSISTTRRQILAMATATCGVTVAASLFNPARADLVAKLGKFLYLDPTVLNFAFEMEELERDLFSRLPRGKGYAMLTGSERNIINLMAQQAGEQYDILNGLRNSLGFEDAGASETPNDYSSRRPRMFTYPSLSNRENTLQTVLDVTETVLFAYHGAVGVVRNKTLLKTAAAIAGVKGRHTAILRQAMGLNPVPAPFEGALAAQVAGRKLGKYGFAGGAPR